MNVSRTPDVCDGSELSFFFRMVWFKMIKKKAFPSVDSYLLWTGFDFEKRKKQKKIVNFFFLLENV